MTKLRTLDTDGQKKEVCTPLNSDKKQVKKPVAELIDLFMKGKNIG